MNVQTKSNYKLLDLLLPERLDHLIEDKIKEKKKFLEVTLRGDDEANFEQNLRDKKMTLMEQRHRKKQERPAKRWRIKKNQRQLDAEMEKCIEQTEDSTNH